MEGSGDREPDGTDLTFGGERLEPLDRRDRPARDDLDRGVLVRDHQDAVPSDLVAELLGSGGADAEQRGHPTRLVLAGSLHRDPADHDELERIAQGDRAGRDQRREFSERVPRDPDGIAHREHPHHLERGDVAREQRRLDELGRGERIFVATPKDHIPTHRVRCFIEHRLPRRIRRPSVGHPHELRPLPRE